MTERRETRQRFYPSEQRQQGATLVVALIVLLALTLLSTSFLENNVLQSKMTANQQDIELAFQQAEDQLLAAEEWLETVYDPDSSNLRLYSKVAAGGDKKGLVIDSRSDSSLTSSLAQKHNRTPWESRTVSGITGIPDNRVTIELIEVIPDDIGSTNDYLPQSSLDRFRQTSLSAGITNKSEVILVTEYQKRFR